MRSNRQLHNVQVMDDFGNQKHTRARLSSTLVCAPRHSKGGEEGRGKTFTPACRS